MPAGNDRLHQRGMPLSAIQQQKKRSVRLRGGQRLKHLPGGRWIGPIIDGEREAPGM